MPAHRAVSRAVALLNLTGICRSPINAVRWERIEPWSAARVYLGSGTDARTLVVKWIEDGPGQAPTAHRRLRTELAALQFLGDDIGTGLAPRVIAADTGLLVLEDLAPRVALDRLIRRDGAAPHSERLAAFARARGELGAATAGQGDTYYSRLARLGSIDPAADRMGRHASHRDAGIAHAVALGAPLDGRSARELAATLDELCDPGPFLALSNGDAEANNILLHASGTPDARLIDFEFAGYAHALTDAVCLYVPGPAWMSVGDPQRTGLAGHYRSALARTVPEAEDDRRYGFGLAAASMSWALIRMQRFAVLDTRPPGHHSRLQLIATLEAAAHTAETHHALPHLSAWIHLIATLLRHRWRDADQDYADAATFPPYLART